MRLYKHNSMSFTLLTHDKRIYSLNQQGERFVYQYHGKASDHYAAGGMLLREIPNFLKAICFNLNRKPNEK